MSLLQTILEQAILRVKANVKDFYSMAPTVLSMIIFIIINVIYLLISPITGTLFSGWYKERLPELLQELNDMLNINHLAQTSRLTIVPLLS